MDLSGLEDMIPNIAAWLNVEPATVLLMLGVIVTVANLTSRAIPDDATGFLRYLRLACKVIGLYASNRVTAGVKTSDVVSGIVEAHIDRVTRKNIFGGGQKPTDQQVQEKFE